MKIESKILDHEITDVKLITSSTHRSYFYVDAWVYVSMEIDNKEYTAMLQPGLTYLMNDYDLPSPELELYDGDGLLKKLDDCNQKELKDEELVASLNKELSLSYSTNDYVAIYRELRLTILSAQGLVNAKQKELKDALEKDTRYYVYVDAYSYIDDMERPAYSMRFNSKKAAQAEIDKRAQAGDTAYIVDVDTGISTHNPAFSNFTVDI